MVRSIQDPCHVPLRSLLSCQPYQSPMVPTWTRKNHRQYGYYMQAQKQGRATCPSKSLPALRQRTG